MAQTSACAAANENDCLIAHFSSEIRANPRSAINYNGRGLEYMKKGDDKMAIKDFTKAIEVDPSFDRAYINRGELYLKNGDFQAAIRNFGKAIEIRPDSFYGYQYRADAYFDHQDYELAILDYSRVNDMIGTDDGDYARSAWASLFLKDGEGAIASVQKFLKVSENNTYEIPYMLLVGHLGLRQIHRDSDARGLLADGMPLLKPDAWSSQLMRYLLGDITEKQLLALAIDNNRKLEANAYVGMNQSLLGNKDAALEHLRRVIASGEKSLYIYSLAQCEIRRLEAGQQP
jgi:tetratricopeptide (TPR) repeat protein